MTDQLSNLEERLNQLPPKVAKPFHSLLKVGHIDQENMNWILEAGRLSGDTTRLLGFAVGFLFLKTRSIPIVDVIRMAKALNRRLNLSWSPTRWQDEHDKLSRAITLKALSKSNVRYELQDYRAHLPDRLKGYLIPGSRRLGMEGLRQCHCVASYHDGIANGQYAIATVFQGGKRWTVQLFFNLNKTHLWIGQVRTRFNIRPNKEELREIHQILGIEMPDMTETESSEGNAGYMENFRPVLRKLRQLGVERVVVDFSGCGDSGAIESITATPDIDLDKRKVKINRKDHVFDRGEWETKIVLSSMSLDDALRELTYDYLSETQVNWYDGEGGYGDLIVDVVQGTVELSVSINETTAEVAFYAQRDIQTGEELLE